MLEGLTEFITLIKDYLVGVVEGLITLVQSLVFVFDISHDVTWMPVYMHAVMSLCLAIVIVLRIVGR